MLNLKISVIIPVYNVEKYLSQCLESVIYQTYKNLEIIIVNNGSTDNSFSICKKYAKNDKRIKLFNQENNGVSVARNFGITKATGDYIHFMDSDDYIPLNYYEKMISSLVNTASDADIVCGGFYFEKHPRESVKFDDIYIYTGNDKIEKTFVYKYMYIWRYLIKKSLLDKTKLKFEEGRYMEDLMFTISLFASANKVITLPNIQYFYRSNPNSIMNSKNKQKQRKRKHDEKYMKEKLKKFAIANHLNLEKRKLAITKYKLFGLFPVLKKEVYINTTIYKLFGIKIIEIK